MYREFHFNAALKENVPPDVINILEYMLGTIDEITNMKGILRIQAHKLFECKRWTYMLRMDSYYFDADTHSTLRHDKINNKYYLCVRCNLKNYDDEIEKFVDWIKPYLDKREGEFLGFYRYEETEKPILLYK